MKGLKHHLRRPKSPLFICWLPRPKGLWVHDKLSVCYKFNFINPDTEGSYVTLRLHCNAYLHVDLPAAQTQSREPIGNQANQSVLMCPTEGFSLLCVLAELEKNTSRVHQSVRGESRGRVS